MIQAEHLCYMAQPVEKQKLFNLLILLLAVRISFVLQFLK